MSAVPGIRLCENPNHRHAPECRQPCEICEVLYPPADLVDWICAACWREHDAMARAYDHEEQARCGFAITEDTTCALKPGHAGYHSPDPDPSASAWKYTPPFVDRPARN